MSNPESAKVSLTFNDVAICFSEKEWQCAEQWQKELYKNVMKEIHEALISLGHRIENPDILFRIKNNEDLFFRDHPYSKIKESTSDPSAGCHFANPDILLRVAEIEELDLHNEPDCDGGESQTGIHETINEEQPEDGTEQLNLQEAWSGDAGVNILTCYHEGIIFNKPLETNPGCSTESSVIKPNQHSNSLITVTIPAIQHEALQGESSCVCTECGQLYNDLSTFIVHQRIHTESVRDGKSLPRQSAWNIEEKPYKCNDCEKSFMQSSGLLKHQRNHTGEKPYKCSQCGKSFSRSSSLSLHKRIHTGEKPYPCTVCEKSFSQSASLIKHKRTHTGERPYACTHCEKTFTQKQHFEGHQRTHTGEKPFTCIECGECFKRKEALNKHKKIHTVDKDIRCVEVTEYVVHEEIIPQQEKSHGEA